MKIPHSKPFLGRDDIEKVQSSLVTGMIASGSEVECFVKEVSEYMGVIGGVASNSGTNALHLALLASGAGPENEVILPSYVCSSVLSAVKYTGAEPVFSDIETDGYRNGYGLSPESVKNSITERTNSIILPHMFGTPAKVDAIMEFGIPVIEDCAQSIGADYKGRKAGSFSDLSIYSFYATKVITTGNGGMTLTNNPELLEKLKDLTKYDGRDEYGVSYNYALTNFQAAMGRNQLRKLDGFIEKRKKIAGSYSDVLEDIGQRFPENSDSIHFRYVVEVESGELDSLIAEMRKNGVMCEKPVFMPLHRYFGINREELPNTERAMNQAISIPIYPAMKETEVEYVCDTIRKLWK